MYPYNYEELHRIANSHKGRPIIEKAKRIYEEKYEKNPTLALKYSLYKLYFETGDRTEFETMYFERRKRLALLQLLAFRDDSYLAPLEDILAAICDEFCWILPAHVYMHPDIDLFSAETSFYLAECDYVFGDKLTEELRRRIRRSVMEKTILPFEERRCLWETRSNNWSAVCAAGIGLACLYLFPERFPTIEKRIFDAFSVYLETIGDDGYCEEGIAYWQYGFGFFSIFFDVYTAITEKRPDILKLKKVCGLVKYAANAQLDGNVFLPYADGGTRIYYEDPGVLFAVKSLFPDLFDYDLTRCVLNMEGNARVLGARTLMGADRFLNEGALEKEGKKCIYYDAPQVFIYKNESYAFTAKGGHNNELHNHNDVGCFQIVKDQKRLIADLGAGEYTAEYFGPPEERYSIFVCASDSHSVPLLKARGQCFGKEYGAKLISRGEDHFALDILGAYEGGATKLSVCYKVLADGVTVRYEFSDADEITFRFVSDFKPETLANKGDINIEGMLTLSNSEGLIPRIFEKEYQGHKTPKDRLDKAWIIDYTANTKNGAVEFYFKIKE